LSHHLKPKVVILWCRPRSDTEPRRAATSLRTRFPRSIEATRDVGPLRKHLGQRRKVPEYKLFEAGKAILTLRCDCFAQQLDSFDPFVAPCDEPEIG
jgi:hypothetical protein